MNKLRLLLFEECNRSCVGCCNKDYDIKNLPICYDYSPYDLIMLTGGEPMLHPEVVHKAIDDICINTDCPIILYTADISNPQLVFEILERIQGITITLHTKDDVSNFNLFCALFKGIVGKSFQVNVFEEVGAVKVPKGWSVKDNIKWIENCPLPDGEVFMRYGK